MKNKVKNFKFLIFVVIFSASSMLFASNDLGVKIFNAMKTQIGERIAENFDNPVAEHVLTPIVYNKQCKIIVYRLTLNYKKNPKNQVSLFVPILQIKNKFYFVPAVLDIDSGVNLPDLWNFQLQKSFDYQELKESLIFKPQNSQTCKHFITLFSDPECPYCQRMIPFVLKLIRNKQVCAYYYSYPLSFHPHAETWSRYLISLIHNVPENKKIEVIIDFYELKDKSLESLINLAQKYKITKEKFMNFYKNKSQKILKKEKKMGEKLHIAGTPTVLLDKKKIKNAVFFKFISQLE